MITVNNENWPCLFKSAVLKENIQNDICIISFLTDAGSHCPYMIKILMLLLPSLQEDSLRILSSLQGPFSKKVSPFTTDSNFCLLLFLKKSAAHAASAPDLLLLCFVLLCFAYSNLRILMSLWAAGRKYSSTYIYCFHFIFSFLFLPLFWLFSSVYKRALISLTLKFSVFYCSFILAPFIFTARLLK